MQKTYIMSRRSDLTSRRSRWFMSQRRDVETNVATFQKVVPTDVAKFGANVATLQGVVKIGIANIATLRSNVAT